MRIVVITTHHRQPLIVPHLSDYRHTILTNPDDPAPDPQPLDRLSPNPLGAFRCFRGHQRAVAMLQEQPGLIIEDDAIPTDDEWPEVVEIAASSLLPTYDVVSLHCRVDNMPATHIDPTPHVQTVRKIDGLGIVATLKDYDRTIWNGERFVMKWGFASLAYLISPSAQQKLLRMKWDGMPVDLILCNRFSFCAVFPSPFRHGHAVAGSIVDTAK